MSNLTFYDRTRIEWYLNFKCVSLRKIAQLIDRDVGVVSREIKRHKPQFMSYNAELAQRAAERKLAHNTVKKLDKDKNLLAYVISQLKEGWSPEQIAGRIKEYPLIKLEKKKLCQETIYQYIYNNGVDDAGIPLYRYLRKKKPFRHKRCSRKTRKVLIPDRISIHARPEEINIKSIYGHWESDTMSCKYRKPVSVQYERKSMLLRINKIANFKPESTNEAITKTIDSLPNYLVKSITYDNGLENCKHSELKEDFNLDTYFCDPYASWQKGGVENMNGLIREYLTRKTNLDNISNEQIYQIQERLNNRPRKSLNYLTPNEIMKMQVLH
jgi:IS30 family transposase